VVAESRPERAGQSS